LYGHGIWSPTVKEVHEENIWPFKEEKEHEIKGNCTIRSFVFCTANQYY
jgi:hypothetical protein